MSNKTPYKKSANNCGDEYDLDDLDDLDDDDDYDFEELFNDFMKRLGTDIHKLRIELKKFSDWYNGMLTRIGCKVNRKSVVCRTLIQYIDRNGCSEDAAILWAVCMSEGSDFIFGGSPDDDEEDILYSLMMLSDNVPALMYRLKNERIFRNRYLKLTDSISFGDKPCADIDLLGLYNALCSGEENDSYINDNLQFAAEKIICSPELSQIMPVVFTALFTRYPKKMYETKGFEPNFKKLLRHIDYNIEKNNGKNIRSFYNQLDMYASFRKYFDSCDPLLCDMGFAEISNITECEMIYWYDYPDITIPVRNEYSINPFLAFADIFEENPFFTSKKVGIVKQNKFEAEDGQRPPKYRIIENADKYIREHKEIREQYYRLICREETDKCVPITMDVIQNFGINADMIPSKDIKYACSAILGSIMDNISRDIKEEMLDTGDKIMKWYEGSL